MPPAAVRIRSRSCRLMSSAAYAPRRGRNGSRPTLALGEHVDAWCRAAAAWPSTRSTPKTSPTAAGVSTRSIGPEATTAPSRSSTASVAKRRARFRSCSATATAWPSSASRRQSASTSRACATSRLAVGSSSRRCRASVARLRAISTRWRSPPDSSVASRSAMPVTSARAIASRDRLAIGGPLALEATEVRVPPHRHDLAHRERERDVGVLRHERDRARQRPPRHARQAARRPASPSLRSAPTRPTAGAAACSCPIRSGRAARRSRPGSMRTLAPRTSHRPAIDRPAPSTARLTRRPRGDSGEQPQEERRAADAGDDAEPDLGRRQRGAGDQIGGDDERGAGERRGRDQPAVRRADHQAQRVRHDQADEADDAADRDGGAGEQRRHGQHPLLGALDVEAERRGRVLAGA